MCACWGGQHTLLGSEDSLKRMEGRDGCEIHMLVIRHGGGREEPSGDGRGGAMEQ